jgi:Flp pilus assembly pilin Flp
MNPLNDPTALYLRAWLASRLDRMRTEDRSKGASAIEWAIITGALALIAVGVGTVIWGKLTTVATNISTNPGTYNAPN